MFRPHGCCLTIHHQKNLPLTAMMTLHNRLHRLGLKFCSGVRPSGIKCISLELTAWDISACTLIWVDHFRVWIRLTLLSIIILPNWNAHQCKISLTSLTHFSIVGTSNIKVKSTLLITFFSWHHGRWSCSHFFGAWIINRTINVLNSVVQKQHNSW